MKKVAVDGPSGAGKSTISRLVAKRLGFIYVDTGAMYRACALSCLRVGVDIKGDPDGAAAVVAEVEIDIAYGPDGEQRVLLAGEDVSEEIRTPAVSVAASDVSAIPAVRHQMAALQRALAEKRDVIMDGRDIGTHVLPDADVKIFLTATAEDRARRRYEELCEKGQSVTYEEVLRDMTYRDTNDAARACAPLAAAEDAIRVDTTGNSLAQSIDLLYGIIKERLGR